MHVIIYKLYEHQLDLLDYRKKHIEDKIKEQEKSKMYTYY